MNDKTKIAPDTLVLVRAGTLQLLYDIYHTAFHGLDDSGQDGDDDHIKMLLSDRDDLEAALDAFEEACPMAAHGEETMGIEALIAVPDISVQADLPEWTRNNQLTANVLLLVGDTEATEEEVAAWTDEQCKLAEAWAGALHLHASDNDDVIVPPRPDFIRHADPSKVDDGYLL